MARPTADMDFAKMLEGSIKGILGDDNTKTGEKLKAIEIGVELLEVRNGLKSGKKGKGFFDGSDD